MLTEVRHRKILKFEIVELLSELSNIELWMYGWASPELVNKKFEKIRSSIVLLND